MAAKRYRERNCDFCGRLFWPKSPSSKACSDECQRARRTAQKRKVVLAHRAELTSEANRPLTDAEELAHERLLDATEGLTLEAKVRLRNRHAVYKRVDINVGMLHPMDVLDDGHRSPAAGEEVVRIEPQEWVVG